MLQNGVAILTYRILETVVRPTRSQMFPACVTLLRRKVLVVHGAQRMEYHNIFDDLAFLQQRSPATKTTVRTTGAGEEG
jgi:hypothetical protein